MNKGYDDLKKDKKYNPFCLENGDLFNRYRFSTDVGPSYNDDIILFWQNSEDFLALGVEDEDTLKGTDFLMGNVRVIRTDDGGYEF